MKGHPFATPQIFSQMRGYRHEGQRLSPKNPKRYRQRPMSGKAWHNERLPTDPRITIQHHGDAVNGHQGKHADSQGAVPDEEAL